MKDYVYNHLRETAVQQTYSERIPYQSFDFAVRKLWC